MCRLFVSYSCDGLYRSKCDNGGPTHVTIGTGGAHLTDDDIGIFTNSWTNTVMLHSYGYGRISVQSKNTLHFEFVKAGSDADTIAGVVLDDFWMNRER